MAAAEATTEGEQTAMEVDKQKTRMGLIMLVGNTHSMAVLLNQVVVGGSRTWRPPMWGRNWMARHSSLALTAATEEEKIQQAALQISGATALGDVSSPQPLAETNSDTHNGIGAKFLTHQEYNFERQLLKPPKSLHEV